MLPLTHQRKSHTCSCFCGHNTKTLSTGFVRVRTGKLKCNKTNENLEAKCSTDVCIVMTTTNLNFRVPFSGGSSLLEAWNGQSRCGSHSVRMSRGLRQTSRSLLSAVSRGHSPRRSCLLGGVLSRCWQIARRKPQARDKESRCRRDRADQIEVRSADQRRGDSMPDRPKRRHCVIERLRRTKKESRLK